MQDDLPVEVIASPYPETCAVCGKSGIDPADKFSIVPRYRQGWYRGHAKESTTNFFLLCPECIQEVTDAQSETD